MSYLKAFLRMLLSIFLLGFLSSALANDQTTSSPDWIVQRRKAVVRIEQILSDSVSRNINRKLISSGVIISPLGIITAIAHGLGRQVSKRDPIVVLADGTRYKAKILIYDENMDLAVLQIEAKKRLPFIPIAFISEKIDLVWSLAHGSTDKRAHQGNVLVERMNFTNKELRLRQKIGSKNVPIEKFIVLPNLIIHEAFVGAGFSGGPLLNSHGELVGINFGWAEGKKGRLGFSLSVINYLAALHSRYSLPLLVNSLHKRTSRYDWFLKGLEQYFIREGLDETLTQNVVRKVRNPDMNFRESWHRFTRIRQEIKKNMFVQQASKIE